MQGLASLPTFYRISQHFQLVSIPFQYLYSVDPKSIPMKKIYFILLMVSSFVLFAQEPEQFKNDRNEDIEGFKLYPNPAINDVVYITTEKNAWKDIMVYDVFGEVVLTDRILNTSLNISRLIPGVYVLQVTENNNTITRKLVVK